MVTYKSIGNHFLHICVCQIVMWVNILLVSTIWNHNSHVCLIVKW